MASGDDPTWLTVVNNSDGTVCLKHPITGDILSRVYGESIGFVKDEGRPPSERQCLKLDNYDSTKPNGYNDVASCFRFNPDCGVLRYNSGGTMLEGSIPVQYEIHELDKTKVMFRLTEQLPGTTCVNVLNFGEGLANGYKCVDVTTSEIATHLHKLSVIHDQQKSDLHKQLKQIHRKLNHLDEMSLYSMGPGLSS